jgi:iron(III) transport system permease protein
MLAAVLLGLIGVPLAQPALELFSYPDAWRVWEESNRLLALAKNTVLLVCGTLALTLPTGIAGAVLLYRSDLPLRRSFRFVVVLTLFIPLPLFASAWQATLGAGGWLSSLGWFSQYSAPLQLPQSTTAVWQPWVQGMGAAIWVHAMAALPWVIWIVGQGLSWVERDLEEVALLSAPPWRVLLWVTLPRCRMAILAAAMVVAVQCATEITVTDLMQVRTFAEEVYTQFIVQDRAVLGRAVAVSFPSVLLLAVLLAFNGHRWQQSLPALDQMAPPICLFPLGKARRLVLAAVLFSVGSLALVPIGGLVWKAGLGGSPEVWSGWRVCEQLHLIGQGKWRLLLENLLLIAFAGSLAACLGVMGCWLANESGWFRTLLLMLAAFAWALPGPVVGIGLKETIQCLLTAEEAVGLDSAGPLRKVLYEGPSLVPVIWVSLIRFFPVALALLWPAVRFLPNELRDAARIDGARPLDELLTLIVPLCGGACLQAGLAVAVLSLGELSAGKLVETPGSTTLAHVIFEQMHRGVPSDVAALCLVLLIMIVGVGSIGAMIKTKARYFS